jgi:hypothetical protein
MMILKAISLLAKQKRDVSITSKTTPVARIIIVE